MSADLVTRSLFKSLEEKKSDMQKNLMQLCLDKHIIDDAKEKQLKRANLLTEQDRIMDQILAIGSEITKKKDLSVHLRYKQFLEDLTFIQAVYYDGEVYMKDEL